MWSNDQFFVDNTGLVIGHTSQIDFGAIPEFQVLGTGGSDSSIAMGRWSNNTGGATFRFLKSRNATIGSNTIVQDGDELGRIRWQGDDGTDFSTNAGEISVEVDGTPAANDMPGRILFSTTNDGSSSVTEKMRLTNAGRLGIGTISPSVLLDLVGDINAFNATFEGVNASNDINAIRHCVPDGNCYSSGEILSVSDGNNFYVEVAGDTMTGQLVADGGIKLNDNNKTVYGTGEDATIYYDGTNLIIDPKEVGSGRVNLSGNLDVAENIAAGSSAVVSSTTIANFTATAQSDTSVGVQGSIGYSGVDPSIKGLSFVASHSASGLSSMSPMGVDATASIAVDANGGTNNITGVAGNIV